ncbi:hypothetical protein PORY_002575 [Pneumocystis oryctolagi]|uniref:Uncharacterized protein n=1 Tax=Pneumocystis oryctolagi TaxID=42067 RepID=A0ACB7C8N9_9ASCO|nr:hypothetical protein PORY_002575 [Pneumocystis oryctolagi]
MSLLTNSHLIFLLESAFHSILERNKLKSLNLETSLEDEQQIHKTMKSIKEGIHDFEKKQCDFEKKTNISTNILKQREYILIKLQDYYRRLEEMLESGSTDDYEFMMDLVKEQKEFELENDFSEISNLKKTDSNNICIDNFQKNQILKTQKQIMKEQDLSLNNLYNSVSVQKKLTIQMESELELHNEFLEEMEVLVDKSQRKLEESGRKIEQFTKYTKKKYNTLWIILHNNFYIWDSVKFFI